MLANMGTNALSHLAVQKLTFKVTLCKLSLSLPWARAVNVFKPKWSVGGCFLPLNFKCIIIQAESGKLNQPKILKTAVVEFGLREKPSSLA